MSRSHPEAGRVHLALALLVSASLVLRILLALAGGQGFWPDEARFHRTASFVCDAVQQGFSWSGFGTVLFDRSFTHWGFKLLATPIQLLQVVVFRAFGSSQACGDILAREAWFASICIQLVSVSLIPLCYGIARRFDASRREALLAALVVACTHSLLYWSRHLVPYDLSMATALLALWLGARSKRPSVLALCGLLLTFAVLTYLGYWLLSATVAVLLMVSTSVVQRERSGGMARSAVSRGLALAVGGLSLLVSIGIGKPDFLEHLLGFSHRQTQGDLSEGWRLPVEYLWHTEHLLLLVWIACVALAAWSVARRRRRAARCGLWLGALLAIYLGLMLGSTVFERFGVYGRLARQLAPFAALLTASVVSELLRRLRRPWRLPIEGALCALLLLQAGFHFGRAHSVRFDAEIRAELTREFGKVQPIRTVGGPHARPPRVAGARYVLVNSGFIWPALSVFPPPEGRVIRRFRGPYDFAPYLYENFDPFERQNIRAEGWVRLIDRAQALQR